MDEVVTIKGAFFGTDATKLAVTFGAAKAQIISLTDQIIEVKVPTGTTYNNIVVTNLINRPFGIFRKSIFVELQRNSWI